MPLFGTDLAAGRYEFKSFTEELLARQGIISYHNQLDRLSMIVLSWYDIDVVN